jgi:hypothetical protein
LEVPSVWRFVFDSIRADFDRALLGSVLARDGVTIDGAVKESDSRTAGG